MTDNISFNRKFKTNTDFSDKVINEVRKNLDDGEIIIPFKTQSQERAEKREKEVGVEYGQDAAMKYFKDHIDSDGNGKISTIEELNKLSDYSVQPRVEGKNFTAKAKAYIDKLYNSAEIKVPPEKNSVEDLQNKYKNTVTSKNIKEITDLGYKLTDKDPVKYAKSIKYLTNLRDAYWMKHAEIDSANRMIAESNEDDLSNIKVK